MPRFRRPPPQVREAALLLDRKEVLPPSFRTVASLSCADCFRPIAKPGRDDWLREHEERGQTVRSFSRGCMRASPHGHCDVIELIQVGPWPSSSSSSTGGSRGGDGAPSLAALSRYVKAFYTNCRVRIAPPIAVPMDNARAGDEGQMQITTGAVFDALRARKQERDVLVSMAVTMIDLYTIDEEGEWNFVFGQAIAMDGIGAFSFARYAPGGVYSARWCNRDAIAAGAGLGAAAAAPAAAEDHPPTLPMTEAAMLMMRRACKVVTHELGHLFGIRHCIYYECLLCGCNTLEEFDARPLLLCPIDLRKLFIVCNSFDIAARYRSLLEIDRELGFDVEVAAIGSILAALEDVESSKVERV